MADRKEDAAALSDADLDDLVGDAQGSPVTSSTDADPAPDSDETAPPSGDTADDADPDTAEQDDEGDDELTDELDGEPANAAPATVPTTALPKGAKPFTFKASGGEHTLPGVHELPDGSVVVSATAQADFRRVLASERELSTNFTKFRRDSQRQLNALKEEQSEKEIEAKAITDLFADMRAMTPDQLYDFVEKFKEETPKIELAIEKKKLEREKKQFEASRNGPAPLPEEVKEARDVEVTSYLRKTYEHVLTQPDAKILSKDEINEVFAKHAKRLDRLVKKNGEAEEYDDSEVIEDLNQLVAIKKRLSVAKATETRNRTLNADRHGSNVIPPVARGGRTTTGGGKDPKQKEYKAKDRKDFRRDFAAGKLDS